MHKLTALGVLVAAITSAVVIAPSIARAQIDGALQYPPASVGKDAQPPPPARMVTQSVSPRRTELGVSGSSQPPTNDPYRVYLRSSDINRLPMHPAPLLGASPVPPSNAGGN